MLRSLFVCTARIVAGHDDKELAMLKKMLVLPLLAMQLSCAVVQADKPVDGHPAGTLVELASGRVLQAEELLERLAAAPLLLVGEKHDNPDHHAIQLELLQALDARRPQGALLLEMVNDSQQDVVDAVRLELQAGSEPEDLPAALQWNAGWDWQQYGGLVSHALRQPWPLLAGDLPRDAQMAIYRNPPELAGEQASRTGVREQLMAEIHRAHCGKLPESQLGNMLAVQQQRDLNMARQLLAAPAPAMLIAGGYHVRKDLGVPLHLADQDAGRSFVVLMLGEEGQAFSAGQADYLWVTPATEEKDYCAELERKK